MRHRKLTVKLGRTSAHRNALLSGLVCNLIKERRITTTLEKARAARRLADKMVTLAKKNSLAARRLAVARLRQKDGVAVLFSVIAPAFQDRHGGYTRLIKAGARVGDNAEMCVLEWVEESLLLAKSEKESSGSSEKGTGGE